MRATIMTVMIAAVAAAPVPAFAQAKITFTNRWKADQKLNIEAGPPASTPAAADWASAAWELERTDDPGLFRIQNAWNGAYLDFTHGKLVARKVNPKVTSARWRIEDVAGASSYVRIRHADTGDYLNVEKGALALGPVDPSWFSAMWKVDRVGGR